jgi:hypothetical protein
VWWFLFKILVSGLTIALCSWLAGRSPRLAGLIIALPLNTLLVLVFTQAEYGDPARSVELARGVFSGVFISLLFFVPFLLAEKLKLGFWFCYASGIGLILAGAMVQEFLAKNRIW